MRSRITIVVFALGTVLGYGSGLAHLLRSRHAHAGESCLGWHDERSERRPGAHREGAPPSE